MQLNEPFMHTRSGKPSRSEPAREAAELKVRTHEQKDMPSLDWSSPGGPNAWGGSRTFKTGAQRAKDREAERTAQGLPPTEASRKGMRMVATAAKAVLWGVIEVGLICAAVATGGVIMIGGQQEAENTRREWEIDVARRKREREAAAAMTSNAVAAPAT